MDWRPTRAMTVKEFRQLRRDRRTVALLIFQPMVLLLVFGFAASFDIGEVPAAVYGPGAEQVAGLLPDSFEVVETDAAGGRASAEEQLRAGAVTAAVLTDRRPPLVLVDGSQLFAAREIVSRLGRSGAPVETEVLFNPDLETPPILIPALAGLVLAFVGTIATSLGVVRERQAGTIEQLAVMPLRPLEVLTGKVLPYLVISLIDLVLVITISVTVFDVPFAGSVVVFAAGSIIFLVVTLGLGLLVSTVSENQGQAMQLSLMVTLPQVLLSGAIFPVDAMAGAVRWIAYLLPLTWFVELARGVMLRGAGWSDLIVPFAALTALATGIFGLATLRIRRDLTPASVEPEPVEDAPSRVRVHQ